MNRLVDYFQKLEAKCRNQTAFQTANATDFEELAYEHTDDLNAIGAEEQSLLNDIKDPNSDAEAQYSNLSLIDI